MRDSRKQSRTASFGALALMIVTATFGPVAASDALWVENPTEIAYTVGKLTQAARELGLSDESLANSLDSALGSAGISTRRSNSSEDDWVLFLDVVVERDSYYTSVGFWRLASFAQPDGESASDFVIVWQDFAVGTHDDGPEAVHNTLNIIIDRFVTSYREANGMADPLHADASH